MKGSTKKLITFFILSILMVAGWGILDRELDNELYFDVLVIPFCMFVFYLIFKEGYEAIKAPSNNNKLINSLAIKLFITFIALTTIQVILLFFEADKVNKIMDDFYIRIVLIILILLFIVYDLYKRSKKRINPTEKYQDPRWKENNLRKRPNPLVIPPPPPTKKKRPLPPGLRI